ncbi:MAG: cytochrome bd ubiquinol oxidase subunit [Solirubrobacteraceae bacterium]|nr:cytochrome bd ubiquinol oxidase subunit [Solirubrobacteraceae bacterium]
MQALTIAAASVTGALGKPEQHDLLLVRELQTMSFVFHIPLVCFGIAFPALVLFVEGLWIRTGDALYKAMAKRWSKVMLILFAIGVVSGTILSFEMGLLWPNFMATFGDVFGLAFGIEGFSFFAEAIFIAMYVYGWERFSPRRHLLLGVPIVIAGVTGSLMVISVNGWMNHPAGFDVVGGRVANVDPLAALFNSHLWHELIHMYVAGYVVVGCVVGAVYARSWLRGNRDRYVRTGLIVAVTVAALAAPVQFVVGDWAGRTVADDQPIKLAAFEGVADTTRGASLHLGGVYENGAVRGGIKLPKALSLLAQHDPNALVPGLRSVRAADRPPVNVVRFSFQAMVAIGTLLALLGIAYVVTWWRHRRLPRSRWFYRLLVVSGPLSVVALLAGWTTTEVGRQPWIVYGFMRTSEGVTAASGIEIAFVVLLAVYLALSVAIVWLLRRLAHRAPQAEVREELRLRPA